jgi:hypothetical protein
MANYYLTAIKSEKGFTFICPKCQAPGVSALGTSDEVGRHLLICPICRTTLGAWVTSESRERELAVLAEKLQRSFARSPSGSGRKAGHPISISRFLQTVKAYLLPTELDRPFWEHAVVVMRKMRIGMPQESRVGE